MDKTYLLVLGTPRSGTTLLTAMIGCHDEVAMLSEDYGRSIRKLISKKIVGNKLCVPNQIELRKRGNALLRKLRRHDLLLYRPIADLSIEDYLRWQPLKVIAIVRDGNAVIASIMKRGKKSYELAAYRWCRGIEIMHELSERYPRQILLLSFEHLVTEPEQAMRAVAEHLDIAYQPQMLEGYAHTPVYAGEKGIDASRTEKHKHIDFNLPSRYPEVYQKYERLLQQCQQARYASVLQ